MAPSILFPMRDRVIGVLSGLAAGDRNGGPIRMALLLAESLQACRRLTLEDVGKRYLTWWRHGGFDTGPTAASVLNLVSSGLTFEEASERVHKTARGLTAGCNPVHRAAPLAMCALLPDGELAAAAAAEAKLTHWHPLAGDVSAAVATLCRALIRGRSWESALEIAAVDRLDETRNALNTTSSHLSHSGFAPAALQAAVHFVNSCPSFDDALIQALAFAGRDNYCPVLVGSIGGARWGDSHLDPLRLEHHEDLLLRRIRSAAEGLSELW